MRPRYRAGLLAAAALLLAVFPASPLAPLDRASETWLERSSSAAVGAYATVRVLNASVSVLKESDLQLEPAGVGVSLAVGQLLDPLDDMTERLSDVVVLAIVTLAAERILHALAVDGAAAALAVLLLALAGLTLVPSPRARPLRRWVLVAGALVVAARLTAPLAAGVGYLVHERYLAPEMQAARSQIEAGMVELEDLVDLDLPTEEGLLGTVTGAGRFVQARLQRFRASLAQLEERVEGLVPALLRLTGLWATSVFLQAVLVPLALFGLAWGLVRALFRFALAPEE